MSSTTPSATIISLDHLVLTVASIPATIKWYTQNLGMKHEAFTPPSTPTETRHSLLFGTQKINLHEVGKEFLPKAQTSSPGTADLCFLTTDPIASARANLIAAGVKMVDLEGEGNELGLGEGVVVRTGARGRLASVYCTDLDGNLIEISNYI